MKTSDYDTISGASRLTGVATSTLHCAIEREEIDVEQLASGTRLVKISDVQTWTRQKRPVGRPKKLG